LVNDHEVGLFLVGDQLFTFSVNFLNRTFFFVRSLQRVGICVEDQSIMDYSQSQQQKRCDTVLLSPAQTPRSSVRRSLRDSLSMDLWSSNIKPDRGVNVEVILRCR